MRIGELAELSNTPTRSLRYYEEQGLLTPRRLDNGYRDYEPHLIDRAIQIRGLIDSGVPSRVIALILPCLDHNRSSSPCSARSGIGCQVGSSSSRRTVSR
jgi:DNA-binding transcriptional MerR regulator